MVNALRWCLRGVRRVAVRAASMARISFLCLAYPGVSISFDSYIGPGCQFSIGRGGQLVLRKVHLGRGCEVDVGDQAQLRLVSVWIGQHSVLAAREGIRIGPGTMVAEMSVIRDANLSRAGGRPLTEGRHVATTITIGRDVWLGARSTVLRGVTIGDSATVGAGAVVTRDVAAGTTVVGVPARARRPTIPAPAPESDSVSVSVSTSGSASVSGSGSVSLSGSVSGVNAKAGSASRSGDGGRRHRTPAAGRPVAPQRAP